MDNVLGVLAFAGIVAAQFLAVVAVSKWHANTSATDDPHLGARAARRAARQRHIRDIAKKGLSAIE